MTPERITELRAIITGSQELTALAASGNDAALAAALSAALPRVPKPETFLGERGIFNLLGAQSGEVFLQTVETLAVTDGPLKAVFARVVRWLRDPIGLDVGSDETQAILQQFVPPFDAVSVAKIITFGSQPQTITVSEVAEILASDRPNGKIPGAA